MSINLYEIFKERALLQSNHLAIVGPEDHTQITYKELLAQVDQAAAKLINLGVKKGQCIALHVPSGRDYIVLTYALWKCGACVVPIAVELVADEKREVFLNIHITGAIHTDKNWSEIDTESAKCMDFIYENFWFFEVESQKSPPKQLQNLTAAFIRFSSGTTGQSKGVIISHQSVYERIHLANQVLEIGPQDNVVWLLSMSYHFTVSIVSYLSFGATILLCKNHFASTIINMTHKYNGTLIYGSPVHYEYMAHDKSSVMLNSLRLAVSTAAYLKKDIAESFYKRFHLPLSEAYGIIEIGLPCINTKKPLEKVGSVGPAVPQMQIQLEDVGLGKELQAIRFKGPGMLDAYYEPWRDREQIMANGWFATGDLGYLDQDNYLFIQGRSKEIINTGGMKFFPHEVERILESHPWIQEAYVYPVDNKLLIEVPQAQVVLKDKGTGEAGIEAEILQFCKQNMAQFKVPKKIEFVTELPRTASGKLVRNPSRIQRG